MTSLGFVGVGRHAQTMRAAFARAGARVVAYDRESAEHALGWGARMPWRAQLCAPAIDALIVCAPPAPALEIAEEAAQIGKRVCVAKPLRWPHAARPQNIWVDLWRLYAPRWRAARARCAGGLSPRELLSIEMCGVGPWRVTHSGLEDYAPHALAFAFDFLPELDRAPWACALTQYGYWAISAPSVEARCGNGSDDAAVRVRTAPTVVRLGTELVYSEALDRAVALSHFCAAFLRGEPHDTLELSCLAMRVILRAGRSPRTA